MSGAAADQPQSFGLQGLAQRLGVQAHLLDVFLVTRCERFLESYGFGCNDVHQRAALATGERPLVDALAHLFGAKDEAATRAAQGLVRGRGHDVGIGHGRGVFASGHQARKVRHVDHQLGADFIGDLAQAGKIQLTRIGAVPRDDQLGIAFLGRLFDLIVIDHLGVRVHAIGNKVEESAREVDLQAVGQVAAVARSMPMTTSPTSRHEK